MSTLLIDEALVLLSIVIFWCTFAIAHVADRLETHKDAFDEACIGSVLYLCLLLLGGSSFVDRQCFRLGVCLCGAPCRCNR